MNQNKQDINQLATEYALLKSLGTKNYEQLKRLEELKALSLKKEVK